MTDTTDPRAALARTREDLATAVRARDPERHFRGLPESPEVIAAHDAVREAERRVAEGAASRRATVRLRNGVLASHPQWDEDTPWPRMRSRKTPRSAT